MVKNRLSFGNVVSFSRGTLGIWLLSAGWSSPENFGTWSEDKRAVLTLDLGDSAFDDGVKLSVDILPFLPGKAQKQRVYVRIGETPITEWFFSSDDLGPEGVSTRFLDIQPGLRDAQGFVNIEFEIENPLSPFEAGISQDTRKLGIAILRMEILPLKEDVKSDKTPSSSTTIDSSPLQIYSGYTQPVVEDVQPNPEKCRHIRIAEKYYDMFTDDYYLEQFQDSGFEPHMVKLFRSLIHPEDYIFDIGANVGCTSILFGELAQRVFSFEPSPSTYSYLQQNIEQSNLKNIELFNIGMGDIPCESEIAFAPSNRSGGFVSNMTKASEGHVTEKITISTIDSFFKEHDISAVNFIKIDVEGFEGHVIRGGTETLATLRPVVVLELNHWCLNAFQRTSIPDFFDFLRGIFPVLFAIEGETYMNLHDENDRYAVMYHHILKMKYSNILAAFEEKRLSGFLNQYMHGPF